MNTFKTLAAAALVCLGTGVGNAASADTGEPLRFSVGVYAASLEVAEAWSCESVLPELEAVMGSELDRDVELEIYVEDDYQAGVTDMTEGTVQFGRFPNIPSKWVLHHNISNAVADAWLAALRTVDPEGVTTSGFGGPASRGCGSQFAMASIDTETVTN